MLIVVGGQEAWKDVIGEFEKRSDESESKT